MIDDTNFIVVEHSLREKFGKAPRYKVVLENADGDRLTKISSETFLFQVYPLGSNVDITARTTQKTLDQEESKE